MRLPPLCRWIVTPLLRRPGRSSASQASGIDEIRAPFEGVTSGNRRTSRAFANRRRPSMTKQKKIVEVTVTNDGGEQVPVGIMNANQALSLPEEMDVSVSHPDRKAGATDELIGRDELRTLTEPWIEPVGIRF